MQPILISLLVYEFQDPPPAQQLLFSLRKKKHPFCTSVLIYIVDVALGKIEVRI
jgi:hypothetical protein